MQHCDWSSDVCSSDLVLLWISPAQRLFLLPLFRAWLYYADQEVSHIPALFESHGNTPGRPGCPRVYTHPSTVFLHTRYLTRLPSKATDIVVRDHANSVMPQRLAADQHSSLVQLLARFILAASVDVALISFSGSLIHPVKWNFTDLSRMSLDRKSTRLNSSHNVASRMPSSA